MNYSNVDNPKYASADGTIISCTVTFDAPLGAVPFLAAENDSVAYGRQIYADCVAGRYGAVAAFAAPTPTQQQLSAYAASKQSAIAAGGISVNVAPSGSPQMVEASTDVASLVLLQGALAIAQSSPWTSFSWVESTGVAVTLNATQIETIFVAVSTFLQATFAALAAVLASIGSGAIATTTQVDQASWPANS